MCSWNMDEIYGIAGILISQLAVSLIVAKAIFDTDNNPTNSQLNMSFFIFL